MPNVPALSTALLLLLSVSAVTLRGDSSAADDPAERDATVTLRLDDRVLELSPEVRVLLAEPPLAPGMAEVRPRYARAVAPFVSVQRGEARGEVVLRGVPEGDVVIVASWQAEAAGQSTERHVVWRDLTARAGEVHRLGHLRPGSATTALTLTLVEQGTHGSADVTALALARPCTLPIELLPDVQPGAATPVLRFDVRPGSTMRLRGARARKVTFVRRLGPEHLAAGWLLGPETRREARTGLHVTRLVARAAPVTFRLAGAPLGSASVRLWARRDEPRGAWLAETTDALPDGARSGGAGATFLGELALAPGPWRVLAQAVDALGAPTGATGELGVEVLRGGVSIEHTLMPAAALVVRGERWRAGQPVAIRPLGWSVDLGAGALGADGRLVLGGLLAEAPHDLVSGESSRRVHTPRAGPPREVRLEWER
jgi:hypothetical protein